MSAIHLLDVPPKSPNRTSTSTLQSVRAEGHVHGLLFELNVEQCYRNASDDNIEAVYTFPVAWNAVLLGIECIIGDKVLQGTVVANADGERRYESALEDGDAAVMVERASDGLYTVNVGNLTPGERAIVRFKYAQLLSFAQGHARLVVPTTIGPRYGKPQAVGMQAHQIPAHDIGADYPFSLSIVLDGELANAVLSSPSHPLSMYSQDGSVTLRLAEGARLDRDVVVVAEGLAGKSITTLGQDNDGYVALASFCPHERTRDMALNVKILVDCSGSMNGDRIEAARRALHDVLSYLEREDNFSCSCFGSEVNHFNASLTAATPRAIQAASAWVSALQADMGGTEITEALFSTYALAQPFEADILLVTDGDVWEAERLIASAIQAGQRIFAVGIGSAPASSLLHALASRTGGACEYVAAYTEIPGAIMRMFHRMRQAPVRDVKASWDAEPRWQTGPGRVLLSGETVHHVAGFAQRPPTGATLQWVDGDEVTHRIDAPIDPEVVDGATLARVAAAMRMADLPPAERHALALAYGLVSSTTNLILVHERPDVDKVDKLPSLDRIAHALPAGWGGLGSVRQGSLPHPAGEALRASTHAAPSIHPAVWRRESASAVFRAAQRHNDTYDIPAFLRKQAPAREYLYRDELRRFAEAMAATEGHAARVMAVSFDAIGAQLPEALVEQLRRLIDDGFAEADVLKVFVAMVIKHMRVGGVTRRLRDAIQRLHTKANPRRVELEQRVRTIVLAAIDACPPGHVEEIPAWLRRAAD